MEKGEERAKKLGRGRQDETGQCLLQRMQHTWAQGSTQLSTAASSTVAS
jgi:hypothetical protein